MQQEQLKRVIHDYLRIRLILSGDDGQPSRQSFARIRDLGTRYCDMFTDGYKVLEPEEQFAFKRCYIDHARPAQIMAELLCGRTKYYQIKQQAVRKFMEYLDNSLEYHKWYNQVNSSVV